MTPGGARKKMENYRRGGNDRRTGNRSDYGRRTTERNFSGNRGGRFQEGYSREYQRPHNEGYGSDGQAPAAPKRRPRVIRGKDGALRSVPATERPQSSGYERRSFGSGERTYGNERNFGGERSFGGERGYGQTRRPAQGRSFGERGDRRASGYDRKPFGNDRRGGYGSSNEGYGDRRNAGRPGFNDRKGPKYGAPKKMRNIPVESGINKMISRKQFMDESRFSDNDLVNIPIKEEVRLNKFIANSGICSRREADNYIQAGVVTVNGEVVTELGTKVNIYNDDVRFNGERLKGEEKVYVVMNKPKGYVTTASDPHAEKTVMDLLKGCKARVFPVGRLDKYTTGVLMFTNDGEIAEKLTHPSYDKKKIYQVTLDKDLTQEDYEKIKSGVLLSDGEIAADELEYVEDDNHKKIGIEIHSGKNRIVRRIFESLGYEVRGLDRVYFAGLTKKGLKRGQWRFLTQGEENILKIGAYN